MSSKLIAELTYRLSHALDQNYDVVNMDTVLSVITALEGTTITKEQLEATRLAKYINQLRRRTKSEALARRAKSLLKKWREMVGIQQVNDTSSSTISKPIEGSNVGTATTPATVSSQFYQQHHQFRSQPTSPIMHHANVENLNSKSVNAPPLNFCNLVATTSALSQPSTSKSSRRLESDISLSAADYNQIKQQQLQQTPPTSFANLISNFNVNDKSSTSKKMQVPSSQHIITPPKSSKKSSSLTSHVSDYSTDNRSMSSHINLNSQEIHHMPKSKTVLPPTSSSSTCIAAPIIIDIEDSNSGSDLIATSITPTTCANAYAPSRSSRKGIADDLIEMRSTTNVSLKNNAFNKRQKRVRKDKKYKDNENQQYSHSQPMIVLDESSLYYQQQSTTDGIDPFPPIRDNKSRLEYPSTNVSEILSLSNSSMSLIFPAEVQSHKLPNDSLKSGGINLADRITSTSTATCLQLSDLTFAGKFKQEQDTSSLPLISSETNKSISTTTSALNFFDNSSNQARSQKSKTQSTATATAASFATITFNSNESTSNSRQSQFDAVNMTKADNLQNENKWNVSSTVTDGEAMNKQTFTIDGLESAVTSFSQSNIVLPVQEDQTPLKTPTTATSTLSPNEKKVPKKRGRKKGSKGVDSLFGKDLSLSAQISVPPLQTGAKKVKTTKELFVEMQNRKLTQPNSAVTSPNQKASTEVAQHQQQHQQTARMQSRPESSCSDAYSDSDTVTSELSRDSTTQHLKGTVALDTSNTNSRMSPPLLKSVNDKIVKTLDPEEQKLLDFLKQLPPPPSQEEILAKLTADIVPCSCVVNKILIEEQLDLKANTDISSPKITTALETATAKAGARSIVNDNNLKNERTDAMEGQHKAVVDIEKETKPQRQKPVKSLFDLDFDDDEVDPLQLLLAETAAETQAEQQQAELDNRLTLQDENQEIDSITSDITRTTGVVTEQIPTIEALPIAIFPQYEIEEDPNCKAKAFYDIQRQQITEFHINSLHNCYIANVNGNWNDPGNDLLTLESNSDFVDSSNNNVKHIVGNIVDIEYHVINVVPKLYDPIPKDLSHIQFAKVYNPRAKKHLARYEESLKIPFLGVAKSLPHLKSAANHKQSPKHKAAANQQNENKMKEPPETQKVIFCEDNTNADQKQKLNIVGEKFNIFQKSGSVDSNIDEINDATGLTNLGSSNFAKNKNKSTCFDETNDIVESNNNNLKNVDSLNISLAQTWHDTLQELPPTSTTTAAKGEADVSSKEENPAILKFTNTVVVDDESEGMTTAEMLKSAEKYSSCNNRRRSSSCSNSSLRKTQQSINLKLKQRVLEQQQQQHLQQQQRQKKRRRRGKSKKFCAATDDDDDESGQECTLQKPRKIKCIRIAINGDVATQRKISVDNNNSTTTTNTTAEEEEEDERESKTLSSTRHLFHNLSDDEENIRNEYVTVNDDNGDCDDMINDYDSAKSVDSNNSSSTSSYAKYNKKRHIDFKSIDQACKNTVENEGDDEENDEEYEHYNDDDEIDEYSVGSGDGGAYLDEDDTLTYHHEVINTRNITATTSGNNHIVLTIKKTPSKTSSPTYTTLATRSPHTQQLQSKPCTIGENLNNVSLMYGSNITTSSVLAENVSNLTATSVTVENTDNMLTTNVETQNEIKSKVELSDNTETLQSSSANQCLNNDNLKNELKIPKKNEKKEALGDNSNAMHNKKDMKILAIDRKIDKFILKGKLDGNAEDPQTLTPIQSSNGKNFKNEMKMHKNNEEKGAFGDNGNVIDNERDMKILAIDRLDDKTIVRGKLHQLFFPHELYISTKDGLKDKVLNIDSCSISSCDEENDSISLNSNLPNESSPFHTKLPMHGNNLISHHNSHILSGSSSASKSDGNSNVNNNKNKRQSGDSSSESNTDNESEQQESSNSNGDDDFEEKYEKHNELPVENNGLLPSFNNLYEQLTQAENKNIPESFNVDKFNDGDGISRMKIKQAPTQTQKENCDEKYINNNVYSSTNKNLCLVDYVSNNIDDNNVNKLSNLSIGSKATNCKYNIVNRNSFGQHNNSEGKHEKFIEENQKQGGTGIGSIRPVNEIVKSEECNSATPAAAAVFGRSLPQQQFKEWHEVLQLKSYNDETLTILPYVVLE